MRRKYFASIVAVAMLAAGVPCAQAEELDANTAQTTDSQIVQNETQNNGSSNEAAESALNASADNQIAGRTVENIDKGWTFSKNDASMEGWTFPTGASEGTIDLPHSWDYAHPTMSYIPQNNRKTVTYSKQLDVAKYHGKNLFIKFYGSNKNTTVKVDGQEVGTHVGGYSAFIFDLTKYVQDKDSVALTVDVTNVDTVSIPINVDYTQFSGIYRDVELIALPNQYISTENKGSSGVFVDYKLNGNNASVNTRVDVTNKATEAANLVLKTTISDNAGNVVSEQSSDIQVSAGTESAEQKLDSQLTNVHRWNGRTDPYLYTMNVSLQDAAGHVLDTESTKIGFRTFKVSNGKAYLNGKQIEIHGVGYHQDREGVGNAVSRDQMAQDIDTMLDMGVNAVRTSHYPHDPAFYEMADEKGLLVYCEIPYYLIYSKADSYKNSITNQLTEMIRQGYNYPSIVMWGVQNEVRYSEQFASYGPDFKVTEDELVAFNSALVDLAHQEDPNRLIVQANIDGADAVNTSAKWSSKIDLTGMNLYVGFKSPVRSADAAGHKQLVESLTTKMNNYQKVLGADSMMLSEYGAGANIDQHTEVDGSFSWNGALDANGDKHYEEYQSYLLEAYWDYIQHSNNVAASFVWNMFDFSSYRNAGGKERLNTKGLLCYDHVTKKDAYYFFKANWNKSDKFVYLTSKRFTQRNKPTQQIKAYSNCDNAELFLNGKSLGAGTKQQDGVFVWDNVKLAGQIENSIKVVAHDGSKTYEDAVDGVTYGMQFEDVNANTPHVEDIQWLADNGVTEGWVDSTGKRTFRGMDTVKRQDMAAFLYRLAGSPDYTPSASDKSRFTDVTEDTPHAKEIWWLGANGIAEGWDDGSFRGMNTVKRQDMAAFLKRLATKNLGVKDSSYNRNPFADVNKRTPHYKEILWMAGTGISEGWTEANGTKTYRGMSDVVRQDMAAFLHRLGNYANTGSVKS